MSLGEIITRGLENGRKRARIIAGKRRKSSATRNTQHAIRLDPMPYEPRDRIEKEG
jgi:hypothetical protein